jgi:hypothetical protein
MGAPPRLAEFLGFHRPIVGTVLLKRFKNIPESWVFPKHVTELPV